MSLSASVSSFHFLPYIPMPATRSYPQQVGVARFTSAYLLHVALSLRFFLPLSTLYTNVCIPVVFPTSGGGQIHLNLAAVWLTPTLHFDPFPSQPSCFLPQPTSSMSLSASVSSFHFLPYIPMSVTRSYPQQVGVARFTSTYLHHVALSLRFFLPLSTLYTNVCIPVASPTSGGGQIHLNLPLPCRSQPPFLPSTFYLIYQCL